MRSTPSTAAELLAAKWPTLNAYWPNLPTVSAKQAAFLCLDQDEAFFGGAAGPGKSDALIAAALQYVDVAGYAAIIFRRTFADLDLPGAAMDRAKMWLRPDVPWEERRKTFTFPSGASLTFGYLEHEDDKYRYKSAEFQYVGFDELTQFSETQYEYLFTRLRAVETIPVPLRMRAASNPGDVGHGWVKRRFITDRKPGVVFIPARLDDHPDESFKQGYRRQLAKLDEVTRRQYEEGDWDAAAGLAFAYRDDLHSVPTFDPPPDWLRLESLDHGLANPTVVLAWCSDTDGNLIVFDSYYSPRNRLISDHAKALLEKRARWWPVDDHGYPVHTTVCHADHDLWGRTGGETDYGDPATLLTEYAAHGVTDGFVQANKDPKAGRARLLELMRPDPNRPFPGWHPRSGETGAPRFFVVKERATELVEQLKVAPTNPDPVGGRHGAGEIVSPKWEGPEGHAVAACRYGALAWLPPTEQKPEPPKDPRAAAVRRMVAHETDGEYDEDY